MRALNFLSESAAKELADKLPSLKHTNYDTIDELMQNISLKHHITGKKLHDLFVSKYGHTPDVWIKKIKQRNEDTQPVEETALKDKQDLEAKQKALQDMEREPGHDKEAIRQRKLDLDKEARAKGLAESKMSEIDIEYQDLQRLPDMAFQSRYKMTKQQWLEKYKNLFTKPTEFQKLHKELGSAPMEESTGQEYVLFVNGKPASKYIDLYKAEQDLKHLQKQFPNQKFEVKQEVCQLQPIPRQIKEALDKLREDPEVGMMPFNEAVETDDDIKQINEFVAWAKKILHVKGNPQFTFSKDTEKAQEGHHTGVHSGNDIWVYIGNRNLIDIFRTVFHELVHQRQEELGMIKEGDSYPGSPIEVMADMLAGKYIKIYGKRHPEIFQ